MNQLFEHFEKALRAYEEVSGLKDSVPILEVLWECYQDGKPVDDGLIRQEEEAIDPIFEELSVDASDALTGLICDLCTAYQRAAFLEGIQIGFHLRDFLSAK